MSQSLQNLEAQFHSIAQVEHALTFLGWDQMVMMPHAGMAPRAAALAELSSLRHGLFTADGIGDWISEVEA